jgi:hypothetical protein
MRRGSPAQAVFPFHDQAEEPLRGDGQDSASVWECILLAAFTDPERCGGFLPQAEKAVRAQPDDGRLLLLAATAALLDGQPARAQIFLKRFSKRYVAVASSHLLQALSLAQVGKLKIARSVLEANGLSSLFAGLRNFPGGPGRQAWLSREYDRIFERGTASSRKRTAAEVPLKFKALNKAKQSAARQERAPVGAVQTSTPPPLPLIDIEIPFSMELNLAPLLTAALKAPARDGGWWGLRERFAHLGLAQGFDELLCLPHLRDIEIFWHQVETVRKVLKQFRGRVLLADEVGLGKTIEAGMVLKEYLLRDMVDSGRRSSRPSSTSPARPPATRCCAAIRNDSGRRSA